MEEDPPPPQRKRQQDPIVDDPVRRSNNNVDRVEWEDLLPGILSHLDMTTLIEKKRVNHNWKQICNDVIDAKRTKAFETNQELKDAVKKYCGYNENTETYSGLCSPEDAEEMASTYGYPINKWGVSNASDLSKIFHENDVFNEDISSWSTLNATNMAGMFSNATSFNQDISSLDTSQVTDMCNMRTSRVRRRNPNP